MKWILLVGGKSPIRYRIVGNITKAMVSSLVWDTDYNRTKGQKMLLFLTVGISSLVLSVSLYVLGFIGVWGAIGLYFVIGIAACAVAVVRALKDEEHVVITVPTFAQAGYRN